MKRWIPILALVLGGMQVQCRPADAPLTTLHAVVALTNEQADRHLRAAFEATVTYFRPYEHTMFVQDGNEAIYIYATTDLKLVPGDRIQVKGTTSGRFRPVVSSSEISLLQHGSPPVPVPASYDRMIRTQLDGQYVVARGTVREANLSLSSGVPVSQLELQVGGGMVRVTMDSPDPIPLKGLLNAEVEVTGVLSGQFDGKMQVVGLLIHSTSLKDMKVLHRATTDAWSVPVTPMDQVLQASNVEDRSKHVRVEGVLTYYRQTSMAVLQDGNRSIPVETPQVDPLQVGDRAEAIGIPSVQNSFLTLKLGEIRGIGPAPAIIPPLLTWDDIASGKYAFNLVSVEGNIVSQVREHSQDVYIVASGKHLFSATIRHSFVYEWNVRRELPAMPQIQPGSRVRVTGVAILEDGNSYNGAEAFGILLRRYGDVMVLAPPPLINIHNLLVLAGLLIAIVFVVVARGWTLALRVRREAARAAMVERARSGILEDISRARPLNEILKKVTDLASYRLQGALSWCQLDDGALLGKRPGEAYKSTLEVIERSIRSHSGKLLGTIFAAIDPRSKARSGASDALFNAAQLAALAIETSGLYSDLIHRSEFDLLTDVHNRFSLEKQLERLVEGERREDGTFGLVYIDLDGFKQVNDQYGHRVGDLYLQESAMRMKRQLRPADMLARLGGDEFAALVPVVRNRADVAEIAARLEHCFDEPFLLDGYSIAGTASVGVAVYPDDGTNKDSLLSSADAAMYVAKNTGRRRIESSAGWEETNM
jgi:diguanylate cyclase (GGDEF)-like protein